jgi:DNA-binding LacI/PurR family transcriptional regulator
MSASPRHSQAKTARERMQARRARLRAQGLRPVQHWVPDLRNPKVQADLRRQAKLLAQPVEGGAVDDWIEHAYDWSEWR